MFKPQTFPISQFSYHAETRSLVADASDIRFEPTERFRLYEDACDIGIAIEGRVSVERFYLAETNHDREGDVTEFVLLPVNKQVGVTVRLFND